MTMFRPSKSILSRFKRVCLSTLLGFALISGTSSAETVTDQRGRQITVPKPFRRIISLYGAHTENLFNLGLCNEIIGVSVNDAYPVQVIEKPKFSYHDDPEKFIAHSPDLVLIRPMIDNGYPDFVSQLERYGIVVASLQPSNISEMFDYWRTLGSLTGRITEAEALVSAFRSKTAQITNLTQNIPLRKKVYFEAIHSRMKTFTAGSMPLFALETAGGINVANDARSSRNTNIANYGKERILAKAGEIDIFLAQKGIMNPVNIQQILDEPGFHIIKAVQTKQVFLIDENIVSRPVPRLYQGIVTIGKLLYPDIFASIEKEL